MMNLVSAKMKNLDWRRFVFLVVVLMSNLRVTVASHWINLHLLHEDQSIWDAEQSSNNVTSPISTPGGRPHTKNLPGCHELPGLTDGQIKLCLLFFDHMHPVVAGAKLGLSECRFQFRNHMWNCTVLPTKQPEDVPFEATTLTPSLSPQSRVLRDNKSNNPQRRRKARNQNVTDNLNLDRDIYSLKSKKKNRKNHRLVLNDRSSGNDNFVSKMTTTTMKTQPEIYSLLHHEKEESGNWNSMLAKATREVGFAQAIWSAAVTEAVARSCRMGSISSCGCGKTPRPADLKESFNWGGCGDNLQYGYKFAQSFVDIREQENNPEDKKTKARALAALHNNEAGRRAVLKKTKVLCKCHGVSGSCAMVTCWHQIPTFREIGDFLKTQYNRATQVKLNRRGRLQVKKSGVPVPSVADLVYIDTSPNYCVQNETLGIYGTSGRVCNRTLSSSNSCQKLCCGRGFNTVVEKQGRRCNCKFLWCCTIECEECQSSQKHDVCK